MTKNHLRVGSVAILLALSSWMVHAQPHARSEIRHATAQPQKVHHAQQMQQHPKKVVRPHSDARPPAHPHGMPPGQVKRMTVRPAQRWLNEGRVPAPYFSPQYVVKDWRNHRLERPPHGYQWMRYDRDYLLVAIASGVIAQLIFSR